MKRLFSIQIFFLLFLGASYSQDIPHFMDSTGYDSLGREQGYWKLITALNFLEDGQVVKGIEGWEYGFFVDGIKEGGWDVKDEKGEIIGYRVYSKGELICEVQYNRKKRVTSIIRSKSELAPPNKDGIKSYAEYVDIVVFSKKGKLKKRLVKSNDGKLKTKNY